MESAKFLVWNPTSGFPTTSHSSFEDAIRESERLARVRPGQQFFVMAPVGRSVVEVPKIFAQNPDWTYTPF